MKHFILAIVLICTTVTSFAGPKRPANGGDAGGGGDILRAFYKTYNPTSESSGFLSSLARLSFWVVPKGSPNEQASRDEFRRNGWFSTYSQNGIPSDYRQSAQNIYDVLQLMFHGPAEINVINAIKTKNIQFIRSTEKNCIHDGEAKYSTAVYSKNNLGKGTICLSEDMFEKLPVEGIELETFALLVHELTHLYGLGEEDAVYLQRHVRSLAHFVFSTFLGEDRDYNIAETQRLLNRLNFQVENFKSVIENYLYELKSGKLADSDSQQISADAYTPLILSYSLLEQMFAVWRGNNKSYYIDTPPLKALTDVQDKWKRSLSISYSVRSPARNANLWFPMQAKYAAEYKKELAELLEIQAHIEKAMKNYGTDFSKKIYNYDFNELQKMGVFNN